MDSLNPQEVIFTGHSLGGAMVQHAAIDMVLNNYVTKDKSVKIYTFGQPRFANYYLEEEFLQRDLSIYRVVHDRDVVPHLPPCNVLGTSSLCEKDGPVGFFPYHAPTEIFYNQDFTSFKECSETEGEDLSCSDGNINFSVLDHLIYFNVDVGGCKEVSNHHH